MTPTWRSSGYSRPLAALLWLGCLLSYLLCSVGTVRAQDGGPMPRPAALEPDVQFWIRVYTQIDTNSGFLHDQYALSVVYDTLHFPVDATPAQRQKQVDEARDRIVAALKRAGAASPGEVLSADDQRIRDLWGPQATPERLRQAAEDVRFQLGQSDRFRRGLVRSGAWEIHIAETLANLGLPAELAALPHVESSFDPSAYSKVGAAGLWQFMRSTGRRYMRIDSAVDDRMDPFRSTEAAAQLLAYNYRLLGTWPLALTAYNHGTAGMLRAKESMGTDDIVRIVRGYTGRTFGFASRNFYVSFLAALEIDRNPEKYFGPLQRLPEEHFQEVAVPGYVPMTALQRVLKTDAARLRPLNPALLPPVWSGQLRVPRDYRLRLPDEQGKWSRELLAQRLGPAEQFAAQPGPTHYRVQRGDTLAGVAERFGIPTQALARANHLRAGSRLHAGRTIVLPQVAAAPAPPPTVASAATIEATPASTAAEEAERESAEDAAAAERADQVAAARGAKRGAQAQQPLSRAQAEATSPSVGPGGDEHQSADPTDYEVRRDDTIRVAPDETLGHFADWLGISAARLRDLNHFKASRAVLVGQRIRLDFHRVSHEEFEKRRRDYHRQLQASYFAGHRIAGTEVYIARPGDSLWTLTQKQAQVPLWLLQQYNPSVNFADLRAGTQIVIPRVADSGGG